MRRSVYKQQAAEPEGGEQARARQSFRQLANFLLRAIE
jgi:hypothetical protein